MSDSKISSLTSATTPLAGTEVLPIVQSSTTVKVATNDLTVKNVRAAATTGILQVSGPAAASTRTMTVPDANFTVARTDAAQTFSAGASTNLFDGTGTEIVGFSKSAGSRMYLRVASNTDESLSFIQSGGGSVLKIGSSYDVTVSNGNLIQGTAAKGINFTANTPAAGMTSQLLNWYEEGTWTPTDASGAGLSFTVTDNVYTRKGREVTCSALITFPVTANGGNAQISVPFTCGHYAIGLVDIFTVTIATAALAASTSSFYIRDNTTALKTNASLSTLTIAVNITYQV